MPQSEMMPDRRQVAELIRTAFRNVRLGDGVGLLQGQGLDDYADKKTLIELRAGDEKEDWSLIPSAMLNDNHSSLSFFDAEGMRFHLPAFLIADLKGELTTADMSCQLVFTPEFRKYQEAQFELLDDTQRHAVCEFLKLQLSESGLESEEVEIRQALADYWTD